MLLALLVLDNIDSTSGIVSRYLSSILVSKRTGWEI